MPAGRPRDPKTPYKMRMHVLGAYVYAATLCYDGDLTADGGKRAYVHWGKLTKDKRFEPNGRFLLLPPEERERMIFPKDWDLSALAQLRSAGEAAHAIYLQADTDRMFGATWLLGQIAEKCGLTSDLRAAMSERKEIVPDIMTAVLYGCLSKEPFSRLADWQRLESYPALRELTPEVLVRVLEEISARNLKDLLARRQKRLGRKEPYTVMMRRIRRSGEESGNLPQAAAYELTLYSLADEEPVYYEILTDTQPGGKALERICTHLHEQGFRHITLVSDNEAQCGEMISQCIRMHQPLIAAADVRQQMIMRRIEKLEWEDDVPEGMEWIEKEGVWGKKYVLKENVKGVSGEDLQADRLRLLLYYDPKKSEELHQKLKKKIASQRAQLERFKTEKIPVGEAVCRKRYKYFRIRLDKEGLIERFEMDKDACNRAAASYGFSAQLTLGLNFSVSQGATVYALQQMQLASADSMNNRLDIYAAGEAADRTRDGRRFIEFLTRILTARVQDIWQTSPRLREEYAGYLHMLNAMRMIRSVRAGETQAITPFSRAQREICEECGVLVPSGCEPVYLRNPGQ